MTSKRADDLQAATSPGSSKKFSLIAPIAALGIVFGDIGTSPLYSVNELVFGSKTIVNNESVLGAISLLVWILTIVISIKYVIVVLRADNHGEGGVFALLALLRDIKLPSKPILLLLLVFGAGLLLGDGLITPAISVLSAVEGLSVATETFSRFTVPITIAVLALLFALQSRGTGVVGRFFGPVMLIWFLFLATIGINAIRKTPEILAALNPLHAIGFLSGIDLNHFALAIGSVVLVVTGGEALFADLGHLGKFPIRVAWTAIVFPALILNYLGQGAMVLGGHKILDENIFFSMVPNFALYPSVLLATIATVIASQALISGAYSLVAQGIALKYLPKLRIRHTDDEMHTRTYIPVVNWLLFVGCVFLVVMFQSSDRLAHAYGLAVSADMLITTIAVSAIARVIWRWSIPATIAVFTPFFLIDTAFLSGNITKTLSGGWVPLSVGTVMLLLMTTWKWGRARVKLAFEKHSTMTMAEILEIKKRSKVSFARPIVMLTVQTTSELDDKVPPLLEVFYTRYGALPRQLVLLSIIQTTKPYVSNDERYEITEFENIPQGSRALISVRAFFGFRENPNVEKVIADIISDENLPNDAADSWMIHAGRDRIVSAPDSGRLGRIRFGIFAAMSRQAEPAYSYFGLDEDARLTVEFVPVKL